MYFWWGVAGLALVLALQLARCVVTGLRACYTAWDSGCLCCHDCCCCLDACGACWGGASRSRVTPGGPSAGDQRTAEDQLDCGSSLADLKCSAMDSTWWRALGGHVGAPPSSSKCSRAAAPAAQHMTAALRVPGGRTVLQPAGLRC